ncbi:MAG TPA: translation initiation factor [Chitinophagaceae bacterium]|nr:translation initiation factor [Chitinophagaceae bacterium]
MAKKDKRFKNNIVFSTNEDWEPEYIDETEELLEPKLQKLRVRYETKHRAGKKVTVIDGFVGPDEDLQDLGKKLRQYCGTGGSAKDGLILVQGDHVKKVVDYLIKNGYSQTK